MAAIAHCIVGSLLEEEIFVKSIDRGEVCHGKCLLYRTVTMYLAGMDIHTRGIS